MKHSIKLTGIIFSIAFSFISCKKDVNLPGANGPVQTPGNNKAPIANAGNDTMIILPANSAILNGENSYDPDYGDKIVSYKWRKISGPSPYAILSSEAPKTTVGNLIKGIYGFELTVKDYGGLISKDTVLVKILDTATKENVIVFDNLAWKVDSTEKFVYMKSPQVPNGYSIDSVVSVSISVFSFDVPVGYMWVKISKGGSDIGHYYYKIDGLTIIVYRYYDNDAWINPFVAGKMKVLFK